MLELAQVAVEAAKQSSITVAIPTGVIASIATVVFIKGADYLMGRKKGHNGGSKPGLGEDCLKHRDKLMELDTRQETTDRLLGEVRDDVKEILRRLPKA